MKRALLVLFTMVVLVLTLMACGTTPGANTNSSAVSVSMTDMAFTPSTVTLHKGQSIELVNSSMVPHKFASGNWEDNTPSIHTMMSVPKITEGLNPGDRAVLGPFSITGTYYYLCTIHPGMQLVVRVE